MSELPYHLFIYNYSLLPWKKRKVAPEVDKYRPNVRTLPLSLAPPKLKRLLNVPGLEPEPPKPYPEAGNALGTENPNERTEPDMEIGLTKAQFKRRRKKAMVCPKDKATTEAKAEYGTSERPPVSEDSRASKETKKVTKEEVPISPEKHSSVSSLSEFDNNQITDDNFSQEAGSLSEPLSAEIPAETDIVTKCSEFIESAHQFTDTLQAVSATGGMDLSEDEVVGLAKVVAKCVLDRMSPERAAIEVAKIEGMVNLIIRKWHYLKDVHPSLHQGQHQMRLMPYRTLSESSVELKDSSIGCQDHSGSKSLSKSDVALTPMVLSKPDRAELSEYERTVSGEQLAGSGLSISESSQGTNAKVGTPITLRDEVTMKDEMDSLIKTENCDMTDSIYFKNSSDEVGIIKNDPSTIPYPVLTGFIQSSPSPSYWEKVDVAIGTQINVLISFCITKDPLHPLKGATLYFMREGVDWMLLRQMEGGRLRHMSITEHHRPTAGADGVDSCFR